VSRDSYVVSVVSAGNPNQTFPILVRASVYARSVEAAEEAVCAWAEEVSRPDPDRGVADVCISLPADARPGTSRRGRWSWPWRQHQQCFTFPLAGQVTLADRVNRDLPEVGQCQTRGGKDWDSWATGRAAARGIAVMLGWAH
jgi:hypothetical protein